MTEQTEGNVLQKQVEVIGSKSQEAIAEQSQESLFKEEVDKKEDVYVRGLWKGLTPFAPDQSGVQEMCADSMSHVGLESAVRSSVQVCETWMQSLEEMTGLLRS